MAGHWKCKLEFWNRAVAGDVDLESYFKKFEHG